jgi:dTDP-4-amino-4,6-dideoxygalactose transaminase
MRAVRVPFLELGRGVEALRPDIDDALRRVADSGHFVLGAEVEAFETELAERLGVPHCTGVASGTDAIELALRALEVGPGDEVVTQANTCVPTVAAIERAGATPVLCDVEPDAATIDPGSLEGAIGERTRAVVPVHLYGQCGDMDAVLKVASDAGVPVIEDCAQAIGADHADRPAGTLGRIGCFSFYPTKNLGALGDAGAVATSDPELDERLKRLRHYGQSDRYRHVESGVNSRLDEMQAAILRVKLPHLGEWNRRRAEIATAYDEALADTAVRPLARLGGTHVFHLYVVAAPDREPFQAVLERRGVGTLIHYPLPIHRQPAYTSLANGPVPLPNSEALADRIVSLPLYPELTGDEVAAVASAARDAAEAD